MSNTLNKNSDFIKAIQQKTGETFVKTELGFKKIEQKKDSNHQDIEVPAPDLSVNKKIEVENNQKNIGDTIVNKGKENIQQKNQDIQQNIEDNLVNKGIEKEHKKQTGTF